MGSGVGVFNRSGSSLSLSTCFTLLPVSASRFCITATRVACQVLPLKHSLLSNGARRTLAVPQFTTRRDRPAASEAWRPSFPSQVNQTPNRHHFESWRVAASPNVKLGRLQKSFPRVRLAKPNNNNRQKTCRRAAARLPTSNYPEPLKNVVIRFRVFCHCQEKMLV